MAHVMNLGDETDIKWLFNVDYAVGPGASNRWDDVMLVQHFLNTVMARFDLRDAKGNRITTYLKRDGLFGRHTAEAILGYQNNAKAVRGLVITADGRVDRANQTGWTTHTRDQYTIVHLNRDHRDIYGKMADENDFPEKLRDLLKRAPMVG